jgi:hypothetical protein
MYVEYDAMEQLRRDLKRGAEQSARADTRRRRRARRARARLRRMARSVAKNVVFALRRSATLARRWTAVMLQQSKWTTRRVGERLARAARTAANSAASARLERATADERQAPAGPERPARWVEPAAIDRETEIAELDRRQLWLRENNLGQDHPDVGLLALVVARRERSRGNRLQARFLYERALAIIERSLGPRHPEVNAIASELAELAHESGDLERAVSWESRISMLPGG